MEGAGDSIVCVGTSNQYGLRDMKGMRKGRGQMRIANGDLVGCSMRFLILNS